MISNAGGNKRRKMKKGDFHKRELLFKEAGQEYGLITRNLGERRAEVFCLDGQYRLGIIRGKMLNRVYINAVYPDIDWASNQRKCDIFHKFFAEEVVLLKKYKEIPENMDSILPKAEDMIEFDSDEDDNNDKVKQKKYKKYSQDDEESLSSEESDENSEEEDFDEEIEKKEKAKPEETKTNNQMTDEQLAERLHTESVIKENRIKDSDLKFIPLKKKEQDEFKVEKKSSKKKNNYRDDDDYIDDI